MVSLEMHNEISIKINQLLVLAARWKHGSKICLETFLYRKVTKLLTTLELLRAEKNISTDLESA